MGIFGFGKNKEGQGKAAAIPTPQLQAAEMQAGEASTEPVDTEHLDHEEAVDAGQPYIPPQASTGPYRDSDEQLWHALAWADQLVRAQTLRWRRTIAAGKSEQYWGMVHVTDTEVETFLKSPFMRSNELPSKLIQLMQPYWDTAQGIIDDIDQRLKETPPERYLRLDQLERLFGLNDIEIGVLLVCLLPELDGRYRRLFGYLQDDASRMRPNIELLLQILQPMAADEVMTRSAFNAASPLRRQHLIQISDTLGINDPLSARVVHVDARIVDFLLGSDRLDSRMGPYITESQEAMGLHDLILDATLLEQLTNLAASLASESDDRTLEALPAVLLHGAYGTGRMPAAQALCRRIDSPLLIVDTRAMLRAPESWFLKVDLTLREAALRGAALYWTQTQDLRQREKPTDDWLYLVHACERHPGLFFFASETPWEPAGHFRQTGFMRIDFSAPDFSLRQQYWERYLPASDGLPDIGQLSSVLANGFQLSGGQIIDAIATARGLAMQRDPSGAKIEVEDLYEGCRRQSSSGLITFARLIEPRTDLIFDDLILPAANKRQLNELRDRIRNRSLVYTGMGFEQRLSLGRGLIALFTGASGTGKTMAAELLGREYGMQIFKVDLAAVISKYVGETEKNLARVFNDAEDANAILLFDEGEALFGKRGEVKEARDRWANTEVNYLLQRIEEYRGVVIITTNFRQNMDTAFLRRIHVSVDFPRPEAEARLRIWTRMFPLGVARPSDEALMSLAKRFSLSGGSIKNVVVDAAFRAVAEAGDETPEITIRHLVLGIAREEQKTAKALTKGDFGEEYYAWVEEDIL